MLLFSCRAASMGASLTQRCNWRVQTLLTLEDGQAMGQGVVHESLPDTILDTIA